MHKSLSNRDWLEYSIFAGSKSNYGTFKKEKNKGDDQTVSDSLRLKINCNDWLLADSLFLYALWFLDNYIKM